MSPLIHYPQAAQGGTSVLAQLRRLAHLVPQRGIEDASVNKILYAANLRACNAVRLSEPIIASMTPHDTVMLRRLERGFYYELDDALPTLEKLNKAIVKGNAGRFDTSDHMKHFDSGRRQLGTEETDPIKQAQLIAPFIPISPEVARVGALFAVAACERVIQLVISPPAGFFDRIPFEMEQRVVAITHSLYDTGDARSDISLLIPVLGLIAAVNTTPENDNFWVADNKSTLWKSVDDLPLSNRSFNCLHNNSIKYIGQLVMWTEADLLKTRDFGKKSLREIKGVLAEMNLELGMTPEGWTKEGPPPPKPE